MTKKLLLFALVFTSLNLFAQNPTISNFRIDDSQKSRVYFDSSEPITASDFTGFTISLKNISGITINTDQITDHYLTVSDPFTYWDNNTIRYEGGSNMQDVEGSALHEFTLSYIFNNIAEPESTEERYVTTNANGGGDGTSEETAWTMTEAFAKASAGQTVWIKAGDYSNLNITFAHRIGTPSNPIKFIGYKDNAGDIADNYWDYGVDFDTSEMPTLTGATTESGNAFFMYNNHYVILRNIQIQKYKFGFLTYPNSQQQTSDFIIFDRFNGREFGSKTQPNGTMFNINQLNNGYTNFVGNSNLRVTDAVIQNFSMSAVSLLGDGNNLIDNVKAYNDGVEKPDYQIFVNGDNNIIRNCHIEIVNDYYSPSTHGIGIRGNIRLSNTYNLIEKSTAVNINEGFYIRNYGCNYNVIKDCVVKNNGATNGYRGGVYIWGGADYNIIERMDINDVYTGIGFKDNNEEGNVNDNTIGKHNIIRNCTINNFIMGISVVQQTSGATGAVYDNKIINCTFNKGNWLFELYFEDIKNLDFINCSITNLNYPFSGGLVYKNKPISGVNYTNCNFYGNNFPDPAGSGNIAVEPKFVDEANANFRLLPDSGMIDKGIVDSDINYDFDQKPRPQGTAIDIGAFEDQSNALGVSEDLTICNGADAVLVATGGDSYLWDNGETTAAITVTPAETTTYTVDITNTIETSTQSITVTVNEAPIANAGDDVISCSGSEVILTAVGGDTYEWSTGETTESITVSPTDTATYTVIASNNGCTVTSSDDVIVTVEAVPVLNGGDDVVICVGDTITLTATGSDNYLWDTGEITESITISPTETTTYTVTSNLGNCAVTDEVIVTVNEVPAVNAGEDVMVCNGDSIVLNAVGIGDFLWSNGETSESITVSPSDTTTYTVIASNGCGTEVTDDVVVTVNEVPVLDLGTDLEICSGDTITLTATGSGNSFTWNTGETTESITVSPADTTTYSVTSTLNTCSVTDEIVVTVNEVPSVSLGDDVAICTGESVELTAIASGGEFVWNTGDTGTSITISPTTTTTYSISSTNAACGSNVTDEITVTVTDKPTLDLGGNVEICRGDSVTLTASGTGDTFNWSNGQTTQSITVSPSETFVYSVTTSSAGSCAVTGEVVVTVNDVPTVDLGSDTSICSGQSVTLTAVGVGEFLWSTGETGSSIVINPANTTTYSVASTNSICGANVTDEITISVNESPTVNAGSDVEICRGESTTLTATGTGTFLWNTGETSPTITINPTQTTRYSVTTTLNGCTATDDAIVTVNQIQSVSAGSDITICNGETVILTATGGTSYLWSTGETTASISVNPNNTMTYTVSLANANSCAANTSDEIVVTVNETPIVTLGDNISICAGENVQLTAQSSNSENFLWSTGETTDVITVSPTQTTTYSVRATLNGCIITDELIVTVNGSTSVNAGDDVTICNGDTVTLTATGAGDFLWDTGETTASINVSPNSTTEYKVSSGSGSCLIEDTVIVTVNEIPSVTASNDVTIESGSIKTLTATGSGTFKWSTGEVGSSINVSPTSTTTYEVTADNGNGCNIVSDEVVVNVVEDTNSVIVVSVGEDVSICPGRTVLLNAPDGDDYLWSTGETTSSITVEPTETTIYSVRVYNGGSSETQNVTAFIDEACVAISGLQKEMLVFPNPTKGLVNIDMSGFSDTVKISIFNLNGNLLYSENIDTKSSEKVLKRQFDLSKFKKGIYLIKLVNNNYSNTKKVILI